MSWLKDLFTSSVGTVVEKAGEAIDRVVTSDEERLKLKNELVAIEKDAELALLKQKDETEVKLEEEITKRHQADMTSEEPAAKKVRPYSLVYLLLIVTLLAFTDGNIGNFTVDEIYVNLFQALLLTVFSFYFGGRTLEKVVNTVWGRKK